MRKTFVIILTFIGFLAFGQENNLDRIDNEVESIESDSTLVETEFDWVELSGISTDGGWILKVWRNGKQICKIVEEIGLSYGRIKTTMYLKNGVPIKILEIEENFGYTNDGWNYEELNEVYREIIYVLDWNNNNVKIKRLGNRNMSEASSSMYELANSISKKAKIATAE